MAGCLSRTVLEVAGTVKCTDPSRTVNNAKPGIFYLSRQGLSDVFHVQVKYADKGRCSSNIKLVKNGFKISSRKDRLALAFLNNNVTLSIEKANETQLARLLTALNDIKEGKSPPGLKPDKQQQPNTRWTAPESEDIENQPNNSNIRHPTPSQFYGSSQQRSADIQQQYSSPRGLNSFSSPARLHNPTASKSRSTPLTEKIIQSDIGSPQQSVSSFYGSSNNSYSSQKFSFTSRKNIGLPPPSRIKKYGLSKDFSFRNRIRPSHEQDVQLTGFSNIGNTCYMNAILQSLLGIQPFAQDVANRELNRSIRSQCLFKAAYGLLCCRKHKSDLEIQRIHLRKFKRAISQAATRFSGNLQHDAHEFLCQVLDQLKEDVNHFLPKPLPDSSQDAKMKETLCPVTRTFECAVLHTISCKGCGASVTSEEIYHDFSLDLPTLFDVTYETSPNLCGLSVERLIETYFQPEELEYTCEECGYKHATISHAFMRLPRVLILHLKRYDFNKLTDRHAKKQNNVNLKKFIDIGKLCTSKTIEPLTFTTMAVNLSPEKSIQSAKKYKRPLDDDDSADEFACYPVPSAKRRLHKDFTESVTSASHTPTGLSSDEDITSTSIPDTPIEHTPKKFCRRNEPEKHDTSTVSTDSQRTRVPVDLSEDEQIKWAIAESLKAADQGDLAPWDSYDEMGSGPETSTPRTEDAAVDSMEDVVMDCSDDDLMSAYNESVVDAGSAVQKSQNGCEESNHKISEGPYHERNAEKSEATQLAESTCEGNTLKNGSEGSTVQKKSESACEKKSVQKSDNIPEGNTAKSTCSEGECEGITLQKLECKENSAKNFDDGSTAQKSNREEKRSNNGVRENAMELGEEEQEERGLLGGAPVGSSVDTIHVLDSSDESGLDISKPEPVKSSKKQYRSNRTTRGNFPEGNKENNSQRLNIFSDLLDKKPELKEFKGDLFLNNANGSLEAQERTPTKREHSRTPNRIAVTSSSPFNTTFRPKTIALKDPLNTKYPDNQKGVYSNSSDSSMDERPPLSNSATKKSYTFKRTHRPVSSSFEDQDQSYQDDIAKALANSSSDASLDERVPLTNSAAKKCNTFKRIHRPASSTFEDQDQSYQDDLAKALANSLDDQRDASSGDEQLMRALELSMRDVHTPTKDDRATFHNSADSGFQDEKEVPVHSYRLVSVVSHLGDRSSSGHYISDVYNCKTEEWTSYDDSTATKVDEHTVRYGRAKEGYILFYMYKQCVDEIKKPSKSNQK